MQPIHPALIAVSESGLRLMIAFGGKAKDGMSRGFFTLHVAMQKKEIWRAVESYGLRLRVDIRVNSCDSCRRSLRLLTRLRFASSQQASFPTDCGAHGVTRPTTTGFATLSLRLCVSALNLYLSSL